jgi:hypothetical protein
MQTLLSEAPPVRIFDFSKGGDFKGELLIKVREDDMVAQVMRTAKAMIRAYRSL